MVTAREHASSHWTHEGWGEPSSPEQERLWTLFFTNLLPEQDAYLTGSWLRPPRWVEDLIRSASTTDASGVLQEEPTGPSVQAHPEPRGRT